MSVAWNLEDKSLKLGEIQTVLEAEVLSGEKALGMEIQKAKASDLMSDVLAFCGAGVLLITGLTNSQVVRTAEVTDLCGVVFVLGKRPSEETIRLAREKKIPLLATELPMYEACGILYARGLSGIKGSV